MEKPLENLRVVATEVNPDEIKYRCPFYGKSCDKEYHCHGNSLPNPFQNITTHRNINGCCGESGCKWAGVYITIDDTTKRTKSTWKRRNRKKRRVTQKNCKINKKK